MKNTPKLFGAILLSSIIFMSCGNSPTAEQNAASDLNSQENKPLAEQGLRAANDALYAALNEMFKGNIEPMNAVWSHADYVTQMGPFGGRITGWEAVGADFKRVADMKLGGSIACKEMHLYAGTDMGYVVCVEEGVNMSPDGTPFTVSHRATNIFHLENGDWKLVHHHTDISYQLEDAYEDLKHD
jgi:ketosteroid isomerase-like protein